MIEHAPIGIVGVRKDLRRHAAALFGVGAAAALAGAFLPWMRAPAPGGGLVERTALHGDGALTAGVAAVGVVVALVCALYKPGRKAALFGMLLVSASLLFVGGTVWTRIHAPAEVAAGLWLTLLGGGLGGIATVFFTWALGRAPPESMEGKLPIVPG